jgi:FtsP/CotA-like multicopper oxidase with cupredoxin domain
MTRGKEAVVRFKNNGDKDIAVHVHGQYNRAPFDGWASDLAKPGEYKDYYYPNAQNSRTIWYHDHAAWTTADGAYFGQAGFYLLNDPEDDKLGLPSGDYDVGMALESKMYHENGTLRFETNNDTGLWGDVIQVNGQPWPYVAVEPRKYRIRLLNGAISRAFSLTFTADEGDGEPISFNVISSDCGLLAYPVESDSIMMSMGERYDIVMDFSAFSGQNITLNNGRAVADSPDYAATHYVARFMVGTEVTNWDNNGDLPSTLRDIPPPPETIETAKDFTFERVDGNWLINGVGFADVENRILSKPEYGAIEKWVVHNGGPGTHPVHIHLVDFKILSRTGGRNEVLPYESAGMKDTVYLTGGETVEVVATYAPWAGVYMFHCHNLIHEDHQMLTAINITTLSEWGYDDKTHFIDPMQEEFRPKAFADDDFTEDAIMDKMEWFYNTEAYGPGADPAEEGGEEEETDTASVTSAAAESTVAAESTPATKSTVADSSAAPTDATDASPTSWSGDADSTASAAVSETPISTTDGWGPRPTIYEESAPTTTAYGWHEKGDHDGDRDHDHDRDRDRDRDGDGDRDRDHDRDRDRDRNRDHGQRTHAKKDRQPSTTWHSSTLRMLTRSRFATVSTARVEPVETLEKPFIGSRSGVPRSDGTPFPRAPPRRGARP